MARLLFLCLLFAAVQTQAQVQLRPLTGAEIEDALYAQNIALPASAFEGYGYLDKGGSWLVLTGAEAYHTGAGTLRKKITALALLEDHGGFLEKWQLNDSLEKLPEAEQVSYEEEADICFWNAYSSFADLDGDGYADPLLVYGTEANDEDGSYRRVNLVLYYKSKKYTVRAIECVLDHCRSLRFSQGYAGLPAPVRKHIDHTLQRLRDDKGLLLENG